MIRSDEDWVQEYAQTSVIKMKNFIIENALYLDFPETCLVIVKENTGCFGGIKKVNGEAIPYIQISIPYITEYTFFGFNEYDHIYLDPEIGSIDKMHSWKHTTAAVLCHEMAHAVVMMHEFYKKVGGVLIPETYHAYAVDIIRDSFEAERMYHGSHWQYTYRQLRNEFVNGKPKDSW